MAWLIIALLAFAGAALSWRYSRRRLVLTLVALVIISGGAAWWAVRVEGVSFPLDPRAESRLAAVEGVIESEPYQRLEARGEMGRFDYRPPKTMFILRVERCFDERGMSRPASGGLIVDVPGYDGRLVPGESVRCRGWLMGLPPPMNPGEREFARAMADQGVVGRLSVKTRGNVVLTGEISRRGSEAPGAPSIKRRAWGSGGLRDAARASLHLGMPRERSRETGAMLDALLLGDRGGDMGELEDAFRRTGLAHMLAISGLHLAILVAGAWGMARVLGVRPAWAAAVALVTIALYLLIVPPAVPVLRAGIMTAAGCIAITVGRRIAAMSVLALAAIVLLIWRPGDLFSPGFQLSFGVVAGLIAFTGGVARWLAPPPLIELTGAAAWRYRLRRIAADYLAVTIVAWAVSMPLIAFHFHMISPMAGLLSLAMLPAASILLWIGYLKVALGMALPIAGESMGPLVWLLGDWTAEAVREMGAWRGVAFGLPGVSLFWMAGAMSVSMAWMSGMFRRRRLALGGAVVLIGGWLAAPAMIAQAPANNAALTLNMFAVGDGSCFLLRSGGEAMIFDCGSSNYFDITTVAIEPALRRLGVMNVPTLVLSHPDADHFSGSLELIDGFGVKRLITTQAFVDEAAREPGSAAAHVIEGARRRGVAIQIVQRGDVLAFGQTQVDVLWPPDDRAFERGNDGSVVLRITAAGRRVLLCGDVQQEAMTLMLAEAGDIAADVLELPHHGSMVPAAPAWVRAVNPRVVLQSSGPARLREDQWDGWLDGIDRHITARHGMIELGITPGGEIHAQRTVQNAPIGELE